MRWVRGAILQTSLTVMILSRLIWHHEFQLAQFNATWFIPIVGNIIVPIAGMSHVLADLNWMFFHPALPPMLQPKFFMLLAPPAIEFVAYMKMAGELDGFAYILYGIAAFILLLLLSELGRFISMPFSLTWWAFLFLTAAMTLATAHMYLADGLVYYNVLFTILLIALILIAICLTVKTIQLVMKGKLCVKG